MTQAALTDKQPIRIEDLEIGQVLPGDILDADDKVLFRQGLKLTPQIVDVWKRRGGGPYFLAPGADSTSAQQPANLSHAPDNQEALVDAQNENVTQQFSELTQELDDFVSHMLADETPSLRTIESRLEAAQVLIDNDASLVLQYVMTDDRHYPDQPSMARRSVYMSALAGVVAKEYGLSPDDCFKVSLAGLLHDLALFPALLAKLQDSFETDEDKQAVITRHAFMTTDLLSARTGIPDLVRVIINQVHEQMDGSGYPRGIPGHLINVMARVINLSDAFLTLIAAGGHHTGYVPGDALAYMIHHTSRGAFDRDCMRALLTAATLYGIGVLVSLEDGRQAKVLRSVPGCPMQPVVAFCDDDGQWTQAIDLSVLDIKIVGPIVEPEFSLRVRMPKSKMSEVLWKMDF